MFSRVVIRYKDTHLTLISFVLSLLIINEFLNVQRHTTWVMAAMTPVFWSS